MNDSRNLKVVEIINSPINGTLLVITNPILGLNVITENKIAVSGAVMGSIWEKALDRVSNFPALPAGGQFSVSSCLILGFGVGSNVKQVKKFWPKANITGVEIDPVMVDIGKKYFGLTEGDAEIVIADAFNFASNKKFDLILVDLFIGDTIPRKFESNKFLKLVLRLLTNNGIVAFNRIYSGDHKDDSTKFKNKVSKIFRTINKIYYRKNLLFICQK